MIAGFIFQLRFMRMMGMKRFAIEDVRQIIKLVDGNNDGLIDFNEFKSMIDNVKQEEQVRRRVK